jgi:MYXO-CTERM domain-containing protein
LPALLLAAGLLAPLLATERPAVAFVRSRTEEGFSPYYWRDPRQVLEAAIPESGSGVTAEAFRMASEAALKAWSHEAIACTALDLTLAPEMTADQITKFDGRNRLSMRVGLWCRDPAHPTEKSCHASEIVALTILFKRVNTGQAEDGRILEADIEVNAVDWTWGMISDPPPTQGNDFDLTSAITHEVGHFIGLGHTCRGPDDLALIDDQGNPVPECGLEPSDELLQITSSTMYPMMRQNDPNWRTLSDDERNAACSIYPLDAVPLDEWGGMGGCATTSGPPPHRRNDVVLVLVGLVPLLFAALLTRARRHRYERFR